MSKPNVRSLVFRVMGAVFLASSLSGCFWVKAGSAVLGAIPARGHTETHSGPRVVEETGQAWAREVLTRSGEAFDPVRHHMGETIRVRWTLPVRIGNPVDAVVGTVDPVCSASQVLSPVKWEMRSLRGTASGEELWRVAGSELLPVEPSLARRTLGYQQADRLRRTLSLAPRVDPGWLLIAPRPGDYEVRVEWESADAQQVLAVRPCVSAWVEAPLELAFSITDAQWRTATVDQVSQRPVVSNTSDFGLSAGAVERATSGGEMREERLASRYGLLGAPAYDLSRLHQAAVLFEMTGQMDEDEMEWARAERMSLLEAVRASGPGELCILVRSQGLSARGMRLWGGEPTVPQVVEGGCV